MTEFIAPAVSIAALLLQVWVVSRNNRASIETAAAVRAVNEAAVKAAADKAVEAKEVAIAAHTKIDTVNAALGLLREMIARETVGKAEFREMEARLLTAIQAVGVRVDRVWASLPHITSSDGP